MKKTYFAAVFAALAFFACSNDKDGDTLSSSSNPGGCLLKNQGVNFECVEEDNGYGSKQVCDGLRGEWVNSCPPGGVKCERENDGIKFVANFYDVEHNPCLSL
ncbi:hypothetical protein R83H12_00058 [Fibrobacteria bacterium R8-3-H12]